MKQVSNQALEAALSTAAATGKGRFSLDDVLLLLEVEDAESREVWTTRLRRELGRSPQFFTVPGGDSYVLRHAFFREAPFLVVPSEWEIEAGILLIGHRFATFCDDEVFPGDVVIRLKEGGALPWKTVELPLETILPLHMLYGAEEIVDYLTADFGSNRAVFQEGAKRENAMVKLTVLDMADYYRIHEFEFGDALAATVLDYQTGVFECRYLDGRERSAAACRQWCEAMEETMYQVIARFGDSLSIPDQLREAFFLGGQRLLNHDGGSLDEFYQGSRDLEIQYDRSQTSCIVRRSERKAAEADDDDGDIAIPEGFGISTGAVDSLENQFRELGVSLSLVELDSFVFDQLVQGNSDFASWYERVFGDGALPFADEAQEVVFLNTLEERFEVLCETFDRVGDAGRGELRAQVLELVEARLLFMREAGVLEVAPEQLPEEPWRQLCESSIYLGNILDLLNCPGEELTPEQAEDLSEAIEDMGAVQERALEALRETLKL